MFLSMKYCDDFEKLSQVYRDHPKLQCIEEETYETIWNVVDKNGQNSLCLMLVHQLIKVVLDECVLSFIDNHFIV